MEAPKKSSWQDWANFLRKYMPTPGLYNAQVVAVKGSKVSIIIWKKGKVNTRFGKREYMLQAELWYDAEAYTAMPHESDD